MARKKEPTITVMNIRGATLKGPKLLIQQMSEKTPDLRTTRVIQTFIMENQDLKLGIVKDNKMLYSGVVRWIGNRGNNIDGTVFAVENKDEIKVITRQNPTRVILNLSRKECKLKSMRAARLIAVFAEDLSKYSMRSLSAHTVNHRSTRSHR